MPTLNEVDIFSGVIKVSPEKVVAHLKEFGVLTKTWDLVENETNITAIQFESHKRLESCYAAIAGNLIACTCPFSMHRLQNVVGERHLKLGIFDWFFEPCKEQCQWLTSPKNNGYIRGVILRPQAGDSIFVFDADTEELRKAHLHALQAYFDYVQNFNNVHWLPTIVLSGIKSSVKQLVIDFDGFVTAVKGNYGQGNKWVIDALCQYASILTKGSIGQMTPVNPNLKRGTPKWAVDIFNERRWDWTKLE